LVLSIQLIRLAAVAAVAVDLLSAVVEAAAALFQGFLT
jgi:hypothetical protein